MKNIDLDLLILKPQLYASSSAQSNVFKIVSCHFVTLSPVTG